WAGWGGPMGRWEATVGEPPTRSAAERWRSGAHWPGYQRRAAARRSSCQRPAPGRWADPGAAAGRWADPRAAAGRCRAQRARGWGPWARDGPPGARAARGARPPRPTAASEACSRARRSAAWIELDREHGIGLAREHAGRARRLERRDAELADTQELADLAELLGQRRRGRRGGRTVDEAADHVAQLAAGRADDDPHH